VPLRFINMNAQSKSGEVPLPPSSGSTLRPRRGEVWVHEWDGPVTIVRSWGQDESVCEVHSRASWPVARRRAILSNYLMTKQP
jgi:hypothetical protein